MKLQLVGDNTQERIAEVSKYAICLSVDFVENRGKDPFVNILAVITCIHFVISCDRLNDESCQINKWLIVCNVCIKVVNM